MHTKELNKYSMEELIVIARRVNFYMRDFTDANELNDDEVTLIATYKLITDDIMLRVSNFAIQNFSPIKLLIKKNLREYIVHFTNHPTTLQP